jgi:tetratricopeptide (TPR) repeat protein
VVTFVTVSVSRPTATIASVRVAAIILLSLAAVCADADTIHLKNGRTIYADRVRETATHLEYDRGDDNYAIPRALVDHVTEGGAPPITSSSTAAAVSELPTFTPSVEGGINAAAASSVIKGDTVDVEALDALERSGNAQMASAALFVAGANAEKLGQTEQARTYLGRALRFSPENSTILTHYAAVLVRLGNYGEALPAAEHATRVAPNSADAFTVLGFAQFASDRSQDAVRSWKRSLQIRPDPMVQQYLAKAERELKAEANFSERDTGHFTLRYEGEQTSDALRRQLTETLESDYDDLVRELDVSPHDSIPVVLYTSQAFFDVTQAPGWSAAVNDGKLRIPVSGMTSVSPELSRVLKHELAHSFINQVSHRRAPQWLHEGVAQMIEPRDSAPFGRRLGQLMSAQQALPFNMLEGSFMNFNSQEARLAYDESLAAAEYIRDTYGMSDVRRILERIGSGSSAEAALRATIHSSYGDFEAEIAKYLNSKYGE